jgi:hypothetical protein
MHGANHVKFGYPVIYGCGTVVKGLLYAHQIGFTRPVPIYSKGAESAPGYAYIGKVNVPIYVKKHVPSRFFKFAASCQFGQGQEIILPVKKNPLFPGEPLMG